METLAIASSLFLVSSTLIFIKCLFSRGSPTNLPPGSFGWPIIGETIEFGKPVKFTVERMKKYSSNIFLTNVLGEKIAVICGPSGNKFLFSNEEKYFTPFLPPSMEYLFHSSETTAAQLHVTHLEGAKLIREKLKPNALKSYIKEMDLTAHQQLKTHFTGKTVVEIYPLAKTITLTLACRFFLGIDNHERISRLLKCFDDVIIGMHSVMINFPGTAFWRGKKAAAAIRKELVAVIEEKNRALMEDASSPVDILSHMILASGKSRSNEDIAASIMGFLIAGYSTIAKTITFFMKYVGLDSDIYEKVHAEQMAIAGSKKEGEFLEWEDIKKNMKYSWNVICETMRLVPPIQGTFREVVTEFSYGGYTVPKGWKVYWTVSTTNMNPNYFKEPERFNPSRYDEGEAPPASYTFVPFGGGPRMCPAKEYSRLVILATVHNIVKKYKWEVVDPNEKVQGFMMPEPQKGLPVRIWQL